MHSTQQFAALAKQRQKVTGRVVIFSCPTCFMKTVALIDDDHDDHVLFSSALFDVLPSINYEYYSSGQSAIREICEFKSARPDLIFLDINMPGINGVTVAEQLGKIYGLQMPVVVFSTTITEHYRQKFLKLNVNKFQAKPTLYRELLSVIEKHTTSLQ